MAISGEIHAALSLHWLDVVVASFQQRRTTFIVAEGHAAAQMFCSVLSTSSKLCMAHVLSSSRSDLNSRILSSCWSIATKTFGT